MKKHTIVPDILNSRNERAILELPNYSYCHSTQTQDKNHSFFLGRQSLLKKLKNLVSTAVSKTGVYLVTGNRGVGKSHLVEKVISETSLKKSSISDSISFLSVALFLVLGLQYMTNQDWNINTCWQRIILGMAAIFLFCITGKYSYLRKNKEGFMSVIFVIITGTKELFLLPQKNNSFLRARNVLKLVLLLLLIQLASTWTYFTHFQLFIIYLSAVIGYYYVKYAKHILVAEYRKNYYGKDKEWKPKNDKVSLANAFKKGLQWVTVLVIAAAIVAAICSILKYDWYIPLTCIALIPLIVPGMHMYVIGLTSTKKTHAFKHACKYSYPQITLFFDKINHYIKNSSRIYLKINFGHDVLNERDILRLITRTLTDEYHNFCKSWKHTLYWRALALAIILSGSHLFYKNIYQNDILPQIEKYNEQNSQQYYVRDNIYAEQKNIHKLDSIKNFKIDFDKSPLFEEYNKNNYAEVINEKKNYLFTFSPFRTILTPYFDKTEKILIYDYNTKIKNSKDRFLSEYFKNNNNSPLNTIDKSINRTWCYILNIPTYFWTKDNNDVEKVKNNYNHAPINYAWWIIFFTFYLLGCLLLRLKLITTHYTIKRQLKRLNENITYSIEREFDVSAGSKADNLSANIGIKKKKTRLIADAREIERELQDILVNIQQIPVFMARPEFVIIFDELDKVSPETQIPKQENETKHKETLFSSNSTSNRQAVILKLLSNMKYFLSTANAKFIFIAGREMYDMYLADIADRNNYFGSIFNDVIFVPSFLTDTANNNKQYDITSLVEEYVCRQLIPENYPNIEYNLKGYNKYLTDEIYKDAKDKSQDMKKQKIIATLQQFIIYLAHTSKGAPKKMVQVFESFIEDYEKRELDNRNLVVRQYKNTKLYLNFDYYDQYTIGMTSYLMTPVFNRLSDANIQEHSDKLLVSTLHFVDYMMKFHNHNFSWRSIDISPEIIEINHSPELKAIVNDIVTLFEQIHFHKPVISLFEFKFDALLSQEIFFLSKMDERFSAQFNFSLDESLILKEYYKKLLKEKQAEYEKFKTYGNNYVSSIASLQIVLGDLHFLDDELDVAALYYKDGLYLLQRQLDRDKEKENLEIFYLFIRNQLKLAYLYEKRKQPDFAYLLYGELTTLLIQYRDFDLENIGISVRKDSEDFIMIKHKENEKIEPYDKYIEIPTHSPINDTFIYEKKATYLFLNEWTQNEEWQKDKEKAKIRPMQFEQLTQKTQRILFKNMTFEGLQLLYLPLLAKLQILEKRNLVGILKKDIELIEQEFEFLTRTINHSEAKILAADFYSKIGDILFYKNKVFTSNKNQKPKPDTDKKIDISYYACLYYKKAFIALTVKTGNEKEKKEFEQKTVLQIFAKKANYINSKLNTRYRAVMARVLSNLGDAYFQKEEKQCDSCPFERAEKPIKMSQCGATTNNNAFWENWWIFVNSEMKLSDFMKQMGIDNNKPLYNIELALFLYSLSMKFYRKANQHKHYAFQINKILNCLKYCLRCNIHTDEIRKLLNWNESEKKYKNLEEITSKAIRSLYVAYDTLNSFEVTNRKEDFDKFNEDYNNRNVPLQYIQVDSEVSRIRTTAKELELELVQYDPKRKTETVRKLYTQHITSPYHINYSVSARIQRLRVKERLNREAYAIIKEESFNHACDDSIDCFFSYSCKDCKYSKYSKYADNIYWQTLSILTNNQWLISKTKTIFENQITELDNNDYKFFAILEMLIADSIFCLDEILRLIKTAGDSFIFNHSFFAAVYDRLAVWTSRYEALQYIKSYYFDKKINEKILPKKFQEVIHTGGLSKYASVKTKKLSEYALTIRKVLENMQIDNYLQKFLGNDFKEHSSSHYYREQAIAHYYQTLDTHNGGRAYLNLLEQMYFIKGDYDDVLSHFNVALERFLVNNAEICKKGIEKLKEKVKKSNLYDMDNYFEKE